MQPVNFTCQKLMELVGCDETWLIKHLRDVAFIENRELNFTVTPEIILAAVAAYHMKEFEEHLLSLN